MDRRGGGREGGSRGRAAFPLAITLTLVAATKFSLDALFVLLPVFEAQGPHSHILMTGASE